VGLGDQKSWSHPALDVNVVVLGPAGERSITFADFHRLPGSTPERDNTLDRGDLIVAIDVPPRVEGRASHYLKVRDRESYEFALVSAAAAVATDRRRLRSVRLAMGGVAHKPWRLATAEAALRNVSLDDIDALRSATPSQLLKQSAVYNLPPQAASRWLTLSYEHAVWTLGQTIPYLRLNGVTPPAYKQPL